MVVTNSWVLFDYFRIAYSVWMLKDMLEKSSGTGYDIKLMYDIGCLLFKHLQVRYQFYFPLYHFGLRLVYMQLYIFVHNTRSLKTIYVAGFLQIYILSIGVRTNKPAVKSFIGCTNFPCLWTQSSLSGKIA